MRRIALYLMLPVMVCLSGTGGRGATPQSSLKVDVNLVNVYATVEDESGRYIGGLERGDFKIFEDGVERPIEIFEAEDLTTSLGVLVDSSGSSADVLDAIRSGVIDFAGGLGPDDEIFVMSFAIESRVIHGFDQSPGRLPEVLRGLRAWGTSVFYDALYSGISEVGKGLHARKALVVLSDGGDNRSERTYSDVVHAAQSSMVLLYFVGMGPPVLVDTHTLRGLASMTGGRVVMRDGDQSVRAALEEIRQDLRHQYYLAYHASTANGYHTLRVEVPGRSVTVRARDGYLVE